MNSCYFDVSYIDKSLIKPLFTLLSRIKEYDSFKSKYNFFLTGIADYLIENNDLDSIKYAFDSKLFDKEIVLYEKNKKINILCSSIIKKRFKIAEYLLSKTENNLFSECDVLFGPSSFLKEIARLNDSEIIRFFFDYAPYIFFQSAFISA